MGDGFVTASDSVTGERGDRFRWACRMARYNRPRSAVARLRLLWHDFVLHVLLNRGSERCQECGRDYPLWRADDAAWVAVMGSSAGLLCERCFIAKADSDRRFR